MKKFKLKHYISYIILIIVACYFSYFGLQGNLNRSFTTLLEKATIAMILAAVFYLLRKNPKAMLITTLVVGTVLKVTGGLSALLIHRYNGEQGNYSKYLFYALYPVMWVVLALIKLFA